MVFSTRILMVVMWALLVTEQHCCSAADECSDSMCQENVYCVLDEEDVEEITVDPECSCHCNHGFTCGESGSTCEDIDECIDDPCLVSQVCINTYGGYRCMCKDYTSSCGLIHEAIYSWCPECIESAQCNYCTNFTCQTSFDTSDRCQACPTGSFNLNDTCEICPYNSHSFIYGLTECPCLPNYYRAQFDPVFANCTTLPSQPRNLVVINITNISMFVSWRRPESLGGRPASELYYNMTVRDVEPGPRKNEVVMEKTFLNLTNSSIPNLTPANRYLVTVIAGNALYGIDNTTDHTDNILVGLPEGVGGEVMFEDGVSFYNKLSWSPPSPSNGIILSYTIRIKDSDEAVIALIEGIEETNFDVRHHVNSSGDYYVEIQSFTEVGGGPFSLPVLVVVELNSTDMVELPTTTTLTKVDEGIYGLFAISAIIILVVVVATYSCLYYRRYKKRQIKKRMFRETIALNHGLSKQSMSSLASIAIESGDGSGECATLEALVQQRDRAKSNKYIKQEHEGVSLSQFQSLSQHIPKEIILSRDNIQLSNVIGQGEFGQVYKGYMKTMYKTDVVAVKTLRALSSSSDVKLLMKEIVKMVHFDHPNVMTLLGVILAEGGAPLLVMPYMTKGTLLAYVRENKKSLFLDDGSNEEDVNTVSKTLTDFARQIAMGMQYLVTNKVVHRDLAARNCLLDMSGTVKVADFGLSEDMYCTNYFRQSNEVDTVETKVPIRWMPLESIEEGLYTEKSDVWSYGVTVWEIFTCGKVPYHGISCMAIPSLLCAGEHLERPFNTACSDEMYSLLEGCWNKTPQMRPRFSQISSKVDAMMEEKFGYLIMNK